MKLKDITISEFQRNTNYICTLCGYTSVAPDKCEVLLTFLRDNHGWNDVGELVKAYESLAAGRLEEKMDSFKSLTALSASRVLQSYLRMKRGKDDAKKTEIGYISDDCSDIIYEKTGRRVYMKSDVTKSDRELLMNHWINENCKIYHETRSMFGITATSFDHLLETGVLRITGDDIEFYRDGRYNALTTVTACNRGGEQLAQNEQRNMRQSTLKRIAAAPLGEPWKRYAVACYFENIQP